MAEHLLKRFEDELTKLRYRLVKMGTLVQQQIEYAINSVIDNNVDYANLVIETEIKIDKLDLKIDKQCLKIFALHQPVAMDLRLVLSAVSMNDKLELIGDLATNIAQNVQNMMLPHGLVIKTKLNDMGKMVNVIISKLMDSFVNMDNDLALESIKMDSEIDSYYKENFSILITLMKSDCDLIEPCSYLLDINRNIQAISRQARSIAQELVFLFEAKMIKHQDLYDLDSGDENIIESI